MVAGTNPEPSSADAAASSDERPPLPEMSAEEAALQFETLPDSAEQASGVENHEPMKFVWSKRWPFLSLVPVTSGEKPIGADSPAIEDPYVDTSDIEDAEVDRAPTRAPALDDEAVENFFTVTEQPAEPSKVELKEAEHGAPVGYEPDHVSVDDVESSPASASPADQVEPFSASTTHDVPELADEPADPLADEIASETFAGAASLPSGTTQTETTVGYSHEVRATPDAVPTRAGGAADLTDAPIVLSISNLSRSFGDTVAVDGIDLEVREGSFYGIVGPNGAGKTTTLSMITGLLRPDSGSITVHGIDVWETPDKAKRAIGVLPDRLRLFDRLTGAQLLYYSGVLRGLDGATVRSRVKDLAVAFGLEDALNRLVTDYSAGMTKKVALASAMIHSPRLLVLDEPFESVDPVSAANVIEILQKYVAHGGTVVLSSHGMDLIQRVCDHVAIVVNGQVLAAGAVDDVRGNGTLEDRFVELAGGRKAAEGMEWLHSFSD